MGCASGKQSVSTPAAAQSGQTGAAATLLTASVAAKNEQDRSTRRATATPVSEVSPQGSVIQKLFREMDLDGDGKVDVAELSKALRRSTEMQRLFGVQCAGGKGSAPPMPSFFIQQIAELDLDKDGKISFQEFKSHFFPDISGCVDPVSAWMKLWKLFNSIDTNDDGKVEFDEFMAALQQGVVIQQLFGLERPEALQDRHLGSTLRALVARVDQNQDGVISWMEFRAYFQDRCGLFA